MVQFGQNSGLKRCRFRSQPVREWVRLWENIQNEEEKTAHRRRVIRRAEEASLNDNELDASRKLALSQRTT